MAATLAPNTIDRERLIRPFRDWEADQTELEAQLAESMQALMAYQSHLDAWQRQLADEREQLQALRVAVERERSAAGPTPSSDSMQQIQQELADLRQKVASLTSVLLTRTEELRELDRLRSEANNELALARSREKELAAAMVAQQQKFAAERERWDQQLADLKQQAEPPPATPMTKPSVESPRNGRPKSEPARDTSPVLGSLMEQFGKLRQQRSLGRANNSTSR